MCIKENSQDDISFRNITGVDNVFCLEREKGRSRAIIHLGGTKMILKGYFEVFKFRWSTKM